MNACAKSILEHEDKRILSALERPQKWGATFKQYNQLQNSATHDTMYKWIVDVFNGKMGTVEPALRQYLDGAGLWPPKKSSGKSAVRTRRSR